MGKKKNTTSSVIYTIIAVLALFLFKQYEAGGFPFGGSITEIGSSTAVKNGEIPGKVYNVLEYVKENGKAQSGFVGGRTFQNREKRLPKVDDSGQKIKYQEWDVNRKVQGKNRGAERMVTGSDGRSWYTSDHYKTFTEIK